MNTGKKNYTIDELEAKYLGVSQFFNLADELIATAEGPLVKDADEQIAIVEPLVSEIIDAADILSEEFILLAEARRGRSGKGANKVRIESALRKIFNALNDYQERVKDTAKKAHGSIMNIADPIVQKIQRQAEEIVVMFLEFVSLSLASIMHKNQLESVRVRDPRIALMMHQHAMQQQ